MMDGDDERSTSREDTSLLFNEVFPARTSSVSSGKEFISTTVAFHEICYTMPVKEHGKKLNKVIVDQCTGIMRPGLNAILGPTGSGKTSLLDILAARKDQRYLKGKVLINGEPQPEGFRLMSGFVVQDDTVWGTLTVRENLYFSASLRLARRYTKEDREARVNTIIDDLGLTICSETKVGTDEYRGISGGERKRTCIGMELIINPDVLFLDEPTTGLDSTTAVTVIKLLQEQAKRLRTIIFSIHQPRYSIFKLFDHVTLLSCGKVVYAGSRENSLEYFERLGYKCEMYNNPADHFMDVITTEEKFILGQMGIDNKEANYSPDVTLSSHYRSSKLFKDVYEEASACIEILRQRQRVSMCIEDGKSVRKLGYQSSFLRQFGVLSKRTIINLFRDPRGIFSQLGVNVFLSLVIGAIFFNLDRGAGGIQNRVGVMFFLITNMIFGNMNAVSVFLQQRNIFKHESANGYYRVSAYFLSKVICDTVPMRIIPVTALAVITYFMIGFQAQYDKFFIYLLSLIMTTLPAASFCIFVSSSVNSFPIANVLVSLPFTFTMLFSGFLVRFSDIPVWLHWLQYLSMFKYGLTNLQINELHGLTFTGCGNITCTSGDVYLKSQDIEFDTINIWINIGALGAMTVGLLFLSYIQLRRIKIFT